MNSDTIDFSEFMKELVVESNEQLDSIKSDMRKIWSKGEDLPDDLVNRIFITTHSIKGGFAFIGKKRITEFASCLENFLSKIREGRIEKSHHLTETLMRAVKKTGELLDKAERSDSIQVEEDIELMESYGENVRGAKTLSDFEISPRQEDDATSISEKKKSVKSDLPRIAKKRAAAPARTERDTAVADDSNRKSESELLDKLMNLAGDLVVARNQLVNKMNRKGSEILDEGALPARLTDLSARISRNIAMKVGRDHSSAGSVEQALFITEQVNLLKDEILGILSKPLAEIPGMKPLMKQVDSVTSDLREKIIVTRLRPMAGLYDELARIVNERARRQRKYIRFQSEGEGIELDKSVIETLAEPLSNIVRTMADISIEKPVEREGAGKQTEGIISVKAVRDGEQLVVEIKDDGRGLDLEEVKRRAVEQGQITEEEAEKISGESILDVVFHGTAKNGALFAKGGIVKTGVEDCRENAVITTVAGHGTLIKLVFPFTVTIFPALLVLVSGRTFAIPRTSLEELIRIRAKDIPVQVEKFGDHSVIRRRGQFLQVIKLADLPLKAIAGIERDLPAFPYSGEGRAMMIMVLKLGSERYGLVVDDFIDNVEIVLKPLPTDLKDEKGFSGITTLGDGSTAMVLDPASLAEKAGLKFSHFENKAD
ncbi:MAG: chemotaxis protein CheW [Nitrospinota bacterium]|nr:chemotaxis protein CheW [Nitrospinota bacterium]